MRKLLLLVMVLAFCPGASKQQPYGQPLRFNADGSFKIVQFADTHYNATDSVNKQTTDLMALILDNEDPDLVVFTGDNITVGNVSQSTYQNLANKLLEPVIDRNIPWALVLGNHDSENTDALDRLARMELLAAMDYSVAQVGPAGISGVGNYVLPILGSGDDQTAALLYFLDSGEYGPSSDMGTYGWIQPDQIAWYLEQSQAYKTQAGGARLPALAFFHIPLVETNLVFTLPGRVGSKNETPCNADVNSGMFAAFYYAGDVMGAFYGHDHVNDYIGKYGNIYLGYGRGVGFTSYDQGTFLRGSRVIEMSEGQRGFDSWIRTEGNVMIPQIGGIDDPPPASIDEGMLLYLPFDSDTNDWSGNDQPVTVLGGTPAYTTGKIGSAMTFDGLEDCLDLGAEAGSPFAFGESTDFSISVWIKPQVGLDQDGPWSGILSNKNFWSGANPGYILSYYYPGENWHLNFKAGDSDRVDLQPDQTGLTDGQWHHFVTTVERGGDVVLYMDNVEISRTGLWAGTLNSGLHTVIGRDANFGQTEAYDGYYYKGQMDDLAIWSRAISAAEVDQIYNDGLGGQTPLLPPNSTSPTTWNAME